MPAMPPTWTDDEVPLTDASAHLRRRRVQQVRYDSTIARGLADDHLVPFRLREALAGLSELPALQLVELALGGGLLRLEYLPSSAGLWVLSLGPGVLAWSADEAPSPLDPRADPGERDLSSRPRAPRVVDARHTRRCWGLAHHQLGAVWMVFDRAELEVFRDEDFGAVEPLDPSHLAHVQAPVVPSELAPELRESIQRRAQGSAAERLMAHGLLARSWTPATGGALAALSAFLDGGEHPADELLTIGRQQVSAEPALWKTTTIHLAEATTAALRHAEWLDAEGLAWTLSARDDLESLAILGPEEDWVREIRRHVDQVARTASSAFGTMPLQPEAHLATLVWQAPDAWWLRCADQHAELPRGGTASKLGPQVRR